jgi:hypothetical protein
MLHEYTHSNDWVEPTRKCTTVCAMLLIASTDTLYRNYHAFVLVVVKCANAVQRNTCEDLRTRYIYPFARGIIAQFMEAFFHLAAYLLGRVMACRINWMRAESLNWSVRSVCIVNTFYATVINEIYVQSSVQLQPAWTCTPSPVVIKQNWIASKQVYYLCTSKQPRGLWNHLNCGKYVSKI